MKKNNALTINAEPGQLPESNTLSPGHDGMFGNGPWMEFEDSFIQLLAGFEPIRKYYDNIEHCRQQISC